MAITETTNKGLIQITVGTENGTWGPYVNQTTGILDNSLGGTATIALTNANVVLSSAQYQCNFVTLTGALSANISITLPQVGSFYTVQNLTSNTSTFQVTVTTAGGGQNIGTPWGEPVDIMTDGPNVKFRNLGRIGSYWDHAGSSTPRWVDICTVPPYLYCNGTTFSSATYPILYTIMGGTTTLPDFRGRTRFYLNDGTGRINSSNFDVDYTAANGNTLFSAGGKDFTPVGDLTGNFAVGRFGAGPSAKQYFTYGAVTDNSSAATRLQNMPPMAIGGITMIRAG